MISVLPDPTERSLSLKNLTIKTLFKESFSSYQPAYACTDDAYIVNITSHLTFSLGDFTTIFFLGGIERRYLERQDLIERDTGNVSH
jgi:hypothetical protein